MGAGAYTVVATVAATFAHVVRSIIDLKSSLSGSPIAASAMASSQDEISEIEEVAAQSPGERDFEPIAKWCDAKGNRVIRQLKLEEVKEYWVWLEGQLETPRMPVPSLLGLESVALVHLRASCGREAGYRQVNPEGLKKKMHDIMVAKAWRKWDKASVCTVPELDAEEEAAAAIVAAADNDPAVNAAEPGETDEEKEACNQHRKHMDAVKRNRYLDFHHRACALHFLAYCFYDQGEALPVWFQLLLKSVPVQHEGSMSKLEWRSLGLGNAASLQHGQVLLSWMDILQLILEEPTWVTSGGSSLQERVFQISPEFAAKLSDWKNMKTLALRVHKGIYDYLETAMAVGACCRRGHSGCDMHTATLAGVYARCATVMGVCCHSCCGLGCITACLGRGRDEQPDRPADLASRSVVCPQDNAWQGRAFGGRAAGGHGG